MTEEPSSPEGTVGAMVLMSLVPGHPQIDVTARDQEVSRVAFELQKTAMQPDLLSVNTLLHVGVWAVDRMTEITGRIGSAGEQLVLALSASRDARRWTDGNAETLHEVIAVRAHAETETYWTLGAAHGLGNVLLRMLALHPDARTVVDAAYKKAGGFEPFTEDQKAWESFGPRLIDAVRDAALHVHSPAANLILDAFEDLARSPAWDALLGLRSENFHRWRPQSVPGGTAKRSAMRPDGSGAGVMISVSTTPNNTAPDHHQLLQQADEGLDALTAAADVLDRNFHRAINELGVKIFQIDEA
jgi:hypothetical protein